MLDTVFLKILDMTAAGSLVILAVMAARLLLKRAPKVFSYALWAVVLFRLLCPVTLEAPVSIMPQRESVAESYELSREPVSVIGAGVAAYQLVGDAINGGLGIQHIPTTQRDSWGNREYVTTDWWNVVLLAGQYLWLAGVVGMLLYSVLSYRKLRRKLRVVLPQGENVFLADDIRSPFVVGVFRPRIYLPGGLGEKEREYILLHERQHIRRGDPGIKLLAFLALSLHWFNPLVWLAFGLACRDMEMSCDEAVLKKMGGAIRADYAQSLLTFATGGKNVGITPLAFGEGDPKGRIRNLSKWRKPALWILVIVAVFCTVLGVCLAVDPVAEEFAPGVMEPSLDGAPERLAPGKYIPTGCLYMNSLSSYYPGNLSEDYLYTVTDNAFITQGILIEGGSYSVDVNWGWQTLREAGAQLAFFKHTPYYDMVTGENCLVQPLDAGRFLLLNEGQLYLLQGGVGKEALWYLYTVEPERPQSQRLTLAKVLELSGKGEALTWEDLADFENEDIGSGLYICNYPIDAAFTLQVSDGKQTGSPMQARLVSALTGASVDIRREDVAAFIENHRQDTLTVMIDAAIAEQNRQTVPDGLIHVSSHKLLANEAALEHSGWGKQDRVTEETVYLLVMQKSYSMYTGVPAETGGSCGAVAITFFVDEAGQYTLKEYWTPRMGSFYTEDIRDKFPGAAAEEALNDQRYTDELDAACYGKACTYVSPGNTLRDRIEVLFLEVASAPAQYSMPGPYIEAHPDQWKELIAYGENTLRYCFEEFTPSNQKGLLEMLMALACEEILEAMGERDFPKVEGHGNGSQWFNHYWEYAQLLMEEKSSEDVEKYHPGVWLLVQLRGENKGV